MPARAKKKQPRANRSLVLAALAVVILGGIWATEQLAQGEFAPAWMRFLFAAAEPTGGLRVGLVAGHSGNDSGAVCPDGLTEAEVNRDVTQRVAKRLSAQGMHVDILEEYDTRLAGYRADVFVSLHSDSCEVDYSGFKVASQDGADSASQQLTQCLWDKYEAATGLARHPDTITPDMTQYHAFNKVAPTTPAAIIELGFLKADRELLTDRRETAAKGVADGILCFLAGDAVQD